MLQEQKLPEALASFDAAATVRRDHPLAQRLRAETLFQLGRYQEVVEAFDIYLETGKPLESVYRGRGLARAELGKYPAAIEDYSRALELHPTSAVHAYRGWAYLLCESPKLAERDFQLAIDLDSKNGDAYNGRGFVEATQGKKREAVRDADEAVRQGPASAQLLYNASRIYARCGSSYETRAIDLLRQAMASLPSVRRCRLLGNECPQRCSFASSPAISTIFATRSRTDPKEITRAYAPFYLGPATMVATAVSRMAREPHLVQRFAAGCGADARVQLLERCPGDTLLVQPGRSRSLPRQARGRRHN